MSVETKIRKAAPGDLTYLSNSVKELIEHTRESSKDLYFLDLDQDYELGFYGWVAGILQDSGSIAPVAEIDSKPAGTCSSEGDCSLPSVF